MKPSVDAAKSSVENLVETVKSTVEDAVGRAVEDLQRSEAEGREDLKRSVEEASDVPECFLGKRQCILNPNAILANRAHRGPPVSEAGYHEKGVQPQRREDSPEARCIARGTPSILRRVPHPEAVRALKHCAVIAFISIASYF